MEDGTEVYSTDGEIFSYTDLDFDVGDHYYSGKVENLVPSKVISSSTVTQLMEQLEDSVYEEVGDIACDSVSMPEDKQEELLLIIKDYVDEHTKINCYKVINVEEHTMEEE